MATAVLRSYSARLSH